LEARIGALRSQVRRLLAIHGLSWVLVGLVLAVLACGLADWAIHLAREVRVVLLAGLALLAAWLLAREVIAPLILRFRDLDIALRIEERWPGLNDRLASTVQFLHLDRADELSGSKILMDATVAETLREVERLDFRQAIDRRPVRRAWLSAAGVLALAGLVVLAAPMSSSIAMARLFRPFGPTQWPKRTHLSIVAAPKKVARGEEVRLELAVAPGEKLPAGARITYHFADGETATEPLRPEPARGHLHARIESARQSFTFEVAAGDDRTAPLAVEVVPPPVVQSLSLRVVPPDYTGRPADRLAPGRTQVQAVIGSRVEVSAVANKPIAAATLRPAGEATPGKALPLTISEANPHKLTATLTVAETGSYAIELKDAEGFTTPEAEAARFDIRALKDETPRVSVEDPANDRDITPTAEVPLTLAADDDYGLGALRLLFKVSSQGSEPTKEEIVPLWAAETATVTHHEHHHAWDLTPLGLKPGAIITFHADARDRDTLNGPNLGKSRELRLRVVTPEEIARQLEADQRDIRDQIARIAEMQQQALTPVEEARRTLQDAGKLDPAGRDNLANAAVVQRQVSDRVNSKADGLAEKLRKFLEDMRSMKIDNPDLAAQMQDLQAGTRRIQEQHLGPAEQALTRAGKALADEPRDAAGKNQPGAQDQPNTDSKPVGSAERTAPPESKPGAQSKPDAGAPNASKPGAQDQGQQPGDKAQGSKDQGDQGQDSKDQGQKSGDKAQGSKDQGQSSKDQGQKSGDQAKGSEDQGQQSGEQTKGSRDQNQVQDALAQAGENQKAIADELKRMLDNMKQFETFRGAVQDAKKLLRQQEEMQKTTAEAAAQPEVAGKAADQLDAGQKSKLDNLGSRQDEIARTLQDLESKMDEMAGRLDPSDPMSAGALKDAAQQSRGKGTASKMKDSAKQLRDNQMGQARSGQEQARKDLKDLLDTLQNRREQELARLVKELRDTEKALKDLKQRQAKNREATGKAKDIKDAQERAQELKRLAKEQEQIQQELKKQLARLQKARAENAAKAGSKAAGKMADARKDQEADDAEDAEQEQEDALADLDDAEQETKKARKEAEDQLAMEKLTKLADNLKGLAEQEDKLVTETTDYDKKATDNKALTPAQRASVRALSRVQSALKQETGDIAERLNDDAPVFSLTLKRAAGSMETAGTRLAKIQTDAETQSAERSAARRFRQLLDAMKPEPAGPGQKGGGGGDGGGGGGGGDGDNLTTAAQIKMLKMLQQDVNERTEALDELRARNKPLSPEQEAEIEQLRRDEAGIVDIARDLVRPAHDDGEED
jgi:hypothetical protein